MAIVWSHMFKCYLSCCWWLSGDLFSWVWTWNLLIFINAERCQTVGLSTVNVKKMWDWKKGSLSQSRTETSKLCEGQTKAALCDFSRKRPNQLDVQKNSTKFWLISLCPVIVFCVAYSGMAWVCYTVPWLQKTGHCAAIGPSLSK